MICYLRVLNIQYMYGKTLQKIRKTIKCQDNSSYLKEILTSKIITFSEKQEEYCVGFVDIVNSTKISAKLSTNKICKYYGIFLNNMASVATEHSATVVKNIGDSLLFYFPRTNKNENAFKEALECGSAMLESRNLVNKLLGKEGIPKVDFRVSMDFGPVAIAKILDSSKEDIFGPSVNICSKINHTANPNGMVIGSDMYEIVKKIPGYKFKLIAKFSNGLKQHYPIFSVDSYIFEETDVMDKPIFN